MIYDLWCFFAPNAMHTQHLEHRSRWCLYIHNCIYTYIPTVPILKTTKELLNGHSEPAVPGGFGAAGSPNDSWHQAMHGLTKAFLRLGIGWGEFPTLRKRMHELEFSVQGAPSTKFPDCTYCIIPFYMYICSKKYKSQVHPTKERQLLKYIYIL